MISFNKPYSFLTEGVFLVGINIKGEGLVPLWVHVIVLDGRLAPRVGSVSQTQDDVRVRDVDWQEIKRLVTE